MSYKAATYVRKYYYAIKIFFCKALANSKGKHGGMIPF